MSDLPLDALMGGHHARVVETPPPVVEIPSHAEAVSPPVPAPTQEQIAAVDGAFLRHRHEQETIASLIGLRLSILLMHDLAKDSAATAEEEEEELPDGEPQPTAD
jgi:hypothetical protein